MKWVIFGLSLVFSSAAFALELAMPSVFSDQMVLQRDQKVPVWGTTEPGATVSVEFASQKQSVVANATGAWRIDLDAMDASAESRVLTVTAMLNGENVERTITDVLVGEVWFAGGQSNMYRPFRMLVGPAQDPAYEPIAEYLRNEAATANDPLFRQYRVGKMFGPFERETTGRGEWSKAIPGPVNEFCGTAYFFGRELRRELKVPVALISCNLGATRVEPWIAPSAYKKSTALAEEYASEIAGLKKRIDEWDQDAAMAEFKKATKAWEQGGKHGRAPRKPEHPSRDKQAYGTLYNGMVNPLIPYAIKGAIWYQGESNTGNFPEQYDLRLTALIEGWRAAWEQEKLYFYWCQLASYKQPNDEPMGDEDGWPLVQDRMRRALVTPDTGMAVLNDIGEAGDIHPKNKVDAGKRLSLWALNQAYGRDLVFSGPLYKSAEVKGAKVIVRFDQVGSGLMVGKKHLMEPTVEVDEPLRRFQIRAADGEWKWAAAEIISKDQVAVWHAEILAPVEVRYAWSPNPEGANLYNKEGLPTSVFKTDGLSAR